MKTIGKGNLKGNPRRSSEQMITRFFDQGEDANG